MQGVVILFFALLAWGSSLSWGACVQVSGWGSGQYVGNCRGYIGGTCDAFSCSGWNTGPSSCAPSVRGQLAGSWYIFTSPERCPSGYNLVCSYTLRCDTELEGDSVNCVSKGEPWVWNSANGTCDSLGAADTTYKCVNTTIASGPTASVL